MPKKSVEVNASVLKRIGAFLVDLIILNMVVFLPFRGIIKELLPSDSLSKTIAALQNSDTSGTIAVISTIIAVIAILYFYLFEAKLGQTPGKMLFQIKVVSDTKSEQIEAWKLIVRTLFLIPIFPFILLWIIDPVSIYYSKNNQRLSEIISKTKTVEYVKLK